MSFKIPSLRELATRTKATFRAHMPGTDVEAYPSNIAVIAKVMSGLMAEIYTVLGDIRKQLFVETATWGLDLHAKERPIEQRKANESDEDLRNRIKHADAKLPEGGNEDDYVRWATNCQDVTRAFVTPNGMGIGTVIVWPMMDEVRLNGVPTLDDCTIIKTKMQLNIPLLGELFVLPVKPINVNIAITNLQPDNAVTRDEITQEIDAYFASLNKNRTNGQLEDLHPSNISEVISAATTETSHKLNGPTQIISFGIGEIPIRGVISFV
ncbi:MAG: baseplate J/gp47 family protein [Rhizobiales bacterium]|nr:baseplate J/gp47 family protein [Hyphomicrobiales bacterium]